MQEGLQELELAMLGTPASWLVDLMSAKVHKAGESAPPSSRAPSPNVESWQAPTATTLVTPKEEGATSQ